MKKHTKKTIIISVLLLFALVYGAISISVGWKRNVDSPERQDNSPASAATQAPVSSTPTVEPPPVRTPFPTANIYADEDFLDDLRISVERMIKNDGETSFGPIKKNFQREIDALDYYRHAKYTDSELKRYASRYVAALEKQLASLNYDTKHMRQLEWYRAKVERYRVLYDLYENYGFMKYNTQFKEKYIGERLETIRKLSSLEALNSIVYSQLDGLYMNDRSNWCKLPFSNTTPFDLNLYFICSYGQGGFACKSITIYKGNSADVNFNLYGSPSSETVRITDWYLYDCQNPEEYIPPKATAKPTAKPKQSTSTGKVKYVPDDDDFFEEDEDEEFIDLDEFLTWYGDEYKSEKEAIDMYYWLYW